MAIQSLTQSEFCPRAYLSLLDAFRGSASKKRILGPSQCFVCLSHDKFSSHLALHYDRMKGNWNRFLDSFNLKWVFLLYFINSLKAQRCLVVLIILLALWNMAPVFIFWKVWLKVETKQQNKKFHWKGKDPWPNMEEGQGGLLPKHYLS